MFFDDNDSNSDSEYTDAEDFDGCDVYNLPGGVRFIFKPDREPLEWMLMAYLEGGHPGFLLPLSANDKGRIIGTIQQSEIETLSLDSLIRGLAPDRGSRLQIFAYEGLSEILSAISSAQGTPRPRT